MGNVRNRGVHSGSWHWQCSCCSLRDPLLVICGDGETGKGGRGRERDESECVYLYTKERSTTQSVIGVHVTLDLIRTT